MRATGRGLRWHCTISECGAIGSYASALVLQPQRLAQLLGALAFPVLLLPLAPVHCALIQAQGAPSDHTFLALPSAALYSCCSYVYALALLPVGMLCDRLPRPKLLAAGMSNGPHWTTLDSPRLLSVQPSPPLVSPAATCMPWCFSPYACWLCNRHLRPKLLVSVQQCGAADADPFSLP